MSVKYMSMVWSDMPELNGTNLLVMLALSDHANDDGVCWPSIKSLAKKSRISTRQAKRVVKDLVERGYVRIAEKGGGRGKTTVYVMNQKGDVVSPFTEGKKGDKNDANESVKGDTQGQKGDMAPHAHVEPSLEPTTETPKTLKSDDLGEKAKKPMNEWNRLVAGVTFCVHGHSDFDMLPKEGPTGKGVILRESKIIKDANYTADDVWNWWKNVWEKRWAFTRKDGGEIRRPTPVEVRAGIPVISAIKPDDLVNAIENKTPDAMAKVERERWENMTEEEREAEREFDRKVSGRFKAPKSDSEQELDDMMKNIVGAVKID